MSLTRILWQDIRHTGDACRQLAAQAETPDYFAHNLDALFDVLCNDLPGPIQLEWPSHNADRQHAGELCEQLALLLADVRAERDDFRYRLG
ncbi:barstar family protein [Chitinilyticum piscinae]|uniref:Barstar family protein n=1 Tax=Chitinilyticum piscinae TaxID=2866724 RepID=A0A8J7FM72_9NEIS|nr:barstar family protein [Chitinilyticum piscinae]MBE9608789.1 barstar family protein [Chitinilyticum piscinae]